jgi:signal transduction histidine kinase/DNA-binding response OmpR family regulator
MTNIDQSPRIGGPVMQDCDPRSEGDESPPSEFGNIPINILLVDDEPKNLTVLETLLDDPRYRMIRAESADEALLALVSEEFALIVLDIHMPGMSGFELAQLIKQRKKTACVPIIFLTAYYSDHEHVLEGYETGAVDYLQKPINPAILRSKVSIFAELHMKTREIAAANRALLSEVNERRAVQEELLQLNNELERRVDERAVDLLQANVALRESEERLRLAQTAGGIGVWDWVAVTGEIWWSETMWAIYGATPVSPGKIYGLWRTLIHPDDSHRIEARLCEVLGPSTETAIRDEFRILCPDGKLRWVECVARLERDSAGSAVRMFGVNVDISERKRLEEDLRQVAAELSESDRRKDHFLAMLAHELRNPLAPIRNAVEFLRLVAGDADDVKSAAELMDRQVVQMVRLVDDLLDVSRISRGKIQLRMDRVELVSAITDVVEATRKFAASMELDLTTSFPSQPLFLNADPTRLAQLVGNLLHNASKFTPSGGRVSLTVEQGNERAVLRVRDTGIGIAADQLPHIFEMFVQADSSLERSQGGLGIGLTLVKQLVEMHGGTVEAFSAGAGMGSEFVVQLPIDKDASICQNQQPSNSIPSSKLVGRILVVDDNRDSAESLAALLKLNGNTTQTAFDGLKALEVGATFCPDVVLLDIGLPELNGYDVARKIREQPWGRNIVLIALTGWGKEEDRRRSSEAGFNSHLVKPVEFAQLNALLVSVLPPST